MVDLTSAPDVEPEPESIPPLVAVILTCRCEGCENKDIPITVEIPESTSYAYCGPCGVRIMDCVMVEATQGGEDE